MPTSRRTSIGCLAGPRPVHATLRVGEHHALGRPGGARGVDDRGQVARGRRWPPPRRGRAGSCGDQVVPGEVVGRRRRRVVTTPRARSVGELGAHRERTARGSRSSSTMPSIGPAVADQVLDLLGRRRVVDRDRGGAAAAARPGRARGTRGCCASSARPGRRGRRPGPAGRPRPGPPGRRSSAKVHSPQLVAVLPPQRRPGRGARRRCRGSASATVWPSTVGHGSRGRSRHGGPPGRRSASCDRVSTSRRRASRSPPRRATVATASRCD